MKSLAGSVGLFFCFAACCLAETPEDTKAPNTQELTDPLLTPAEALNALELPDGFQATLFAAEPHVQQPISMTFDARGRLWVAENYTYADRSIGHNLKLYDRIIIFEDTNHDGRFDKRTVFHDKLQRLTSVEVGFGGVWALCPEELLFIPDQNGDDIPDGKPQVVLDGWEASSSRHNFVNGLKWGPDGWLYGRHGILSTSRVGPPGASQENRTELNCSIWKYHPTRKEFDVVCHGTTNPWGTDWDKHGQLYFINTVIGHLWHVVPGAHFRRMYGADFNPHLYQLIEQTADHFHWDTRETWSDIRKGVTSTTDQAGGGHAHSGLMIYLGDNWPQEYHNALFTLNLHGRRINREHLEREGATYVGKHRPDFVKTKDVWFRGLEMIYGPDGGVYVLDWSDIGECHENDGVHRTSGRIFKITHGTPKVPAKIDLTKLSAVELVDLQLHKNEWFARQSRRLLQEQAARGLDLSAAHQKLREIYNTKTEPVIRLRAMWALHVSGGIDEGWLVKQLAEKNEHLRVWAIQLLMDLGNNQGVSNPATVDVLRVLSEKEESGLVLTFLASALQKIPLAQRWGLAAELLKNEQFAKDRVLPLMIWYGIEGAIPSDIEQAAALITTSKIPLVTQFITRRLTYELETKPTVGPTLMAAR